MGKEQMVLSVRWRVVEVGKCEDREREDGSEEMTDVIGTITATQAENDKGGIDIDIDNDNDIDINIDIDIHIDDRQLESTKKKILR
ncbi:hypothetical protein LTR28_005382 [Elasticomyces elasticus]|nr:hypothetical protein LTR28_005382 [Elasticomyces elasticus]